MVDFFNNHSHCIVFGGKQSTLLDVTASIIQGSVIGPAAYVVTAGDLIAAVTGNSLCKYASDTYIIIPASNKASQHAELDNMQKRAELNNLNLSCNKSTEIIFRDSGQWHAPPEPVPLPGIVHSSCMKMLGMSICPSVNQHIQRLVTSCAKATYTLRVLQTHRLDDAALQTCLCGLVG